MRANLPQNEPKLIKYWDDIKLYKLLQSKSGESFELHDTYPQGTTRYASIMGLKHIHHIDA